MKIKAQACAAIVKVFLIEFLILVAVSTILSQATLADSEAKGKSALTHTLKTDYFVVHSDPSDPYLPQLMAESARVALTRVSRDLGYVPDKSKPFTLNVYRRHIDFIEAGGLEDSKFTVGTASSRDEIISVDASGTFSPANEILAHEITHAIIFRLLGPRVKNLPLWANEGIAQYESEEFPDADNAIVAEAAADMRIIPLGNLAVSFPKNKTDLAYAESASAIRYMVKKHGKSAPRTLLRQLAFGQTFDASMVKATGRTGEQFADDWESAVTKQFKALKLTRIAMGAIPVIMAVLAIMAFLVRRRQKIEAAKEWEREQFEDYLRRQLNDRWRG